MFKKTLGFRLVALAALVVVASQFMAAPVFAQSATNPQSESVGLQGTVPTDPPTTGATITFPVGGTITGESETDVIGVCPQGLLVKIFNNGVFAGSVFCEDGTFNIRISLFSGDNTIIAIVFDALDQPGPSSNTSNVTFDDGSVDAAFEKVLITTNFAKRGANPGDTLVWPFSITGGTGPYAISVDWGDGQRELISLDLAGNFELSHIYELAGTYRIVIQATDNAGNTSYLQVVGVANGAIQFDQISNAGGDGGDGDSSVSLAPGEIVRVEVVPWWPFVIFLFLIISTFIIGRRYEHRRLRRKLSSHQNYN